jgi:NADPH:quinone reductase-like Zn-dependent oxidoreductase
VKAGDTVLTLGTGGVSIFALQIAKLFGARVISTTGNEDKVKKLKEHGADEVINYRTHEDWDTQVLELTNKRGVDHVIEVGGTGTLARSVKAVRMAGHIAMIGALSTASDFNPITLFMKSVRLQGIFVGSRAMFKDLLKEVEATELKPVIDRVFEFSQAREAMHYMKSGAHFGKVVIRIG